MPLYNPTIPASLVDAKGDLLVGTADNTVARKAVGASGAAILADDTQSDGLAWITSLGGIKPRTGDYVRPFHGSNSSASVATGTQEFIPIFISAKTTFDRIGVFLQTAAGTTGTVRLGIYSDSSGVPGTLVLDAGTAGTTTGAGASKEITISQQLTPGMYWLSAQSESTGTNPAFATIAGSQTGTVWPFGLVGSIGSPLGNGFFWSHTGAFASNPGPLTLGTATITVYMRAA